MAELDTGLDILAYVLRRGGDLVPTQSTSEVSLADHYIDQKIEINQQYWAKCAERPWRWCRKVPPLQFTTVPSVPVTVSNIAGNVIRLDAVILNSMSGRKVWIESDGIPHRIDHHTAGSHELFLVTTYAGESTSGAATIFQDEYVVAGDILAFPNLQDMETGRELTLIPEDEFRTRFPRNIHHVTYSNQQYATFTADQTIRLAPWFECPQLFELSYNYRPSALDYTGNADTDTPIIPREWRKSLAEASLKVLYSDKSDQRVKVMTEEMGMTNMRMTGADYSQHRPRQWVPRGQRISG